MVDGRAGARPDPSRPPCLCVIVPTRNRAQLAVDAALSAAAAGLANVSVRVSDNSTDPAERYQLELECTKHGIQLMRPPRPLAMAAHWDWALANVLEDDQFTHIAILTDRMLLWPEAFRAVFDLLSRFPSEVISYQHERLDDSRTPAQLEQYPWTGRVLRVPTAWSINTISKADFVACMALPRLLNCVVPRQALDKVKAEFGSICGGSISPDFAFGFRCCAVLDSILFYDRAVLLHRAVNRSNGESAARGRATRDHLDFLAGLDERGLNYASPLPGLGGVVNAILHEYSSVRARCMSWPEVDLSQAIESIRAEAELMENGESKDTAMALLDSYQHAETRHSGQDATHDLTLAWRALRLVAAPSRGARKLMALAGRSSRVATIAERATHLEAGPSQVRVSSWVDGGMALDYVSRARRLPQAGMSSLETIAGRGHLRGPFRKVTVVRK